MQLQLKNNSNSTAVPNAFIERCGSAPAHYTSAYLLGLMYSQKNQDIDFSLFCARLNMSEGDVIEAFEYWQKKGFARIVNNDTVCFEFGVFLKTEQSDELYTEREFNQKLQSIFGSRQLSPHEYLKIYDYTDMFGLPKSVVLILTEYCVLMKGKRVSISYLDKVAKSWAEQEKIDTPEKAREKIEVYRTNSSGVLQVLAQLGISGRRPSKDESALFEKWTTLWGFTLDAILTACAHTTSAREPSMKYLDRILERLKNAGATTSRLITEHKNKADVVMKNIQQLMHTLGEPSLKPTFEYESLYQKWTSVYGYGMPILTKAAQLQSAHGKMPLPFLDDILTEWYNNKIVSLGDAERYIAEKQALDKRIITMFESAGLTKQRIADAHRKTYRRWNTQYGIEHDAILLAAEISSLSENPYRYLNTIMTNWHQAGVKTLADAQQETKKYTSSQPTAQTPDISFERPTENYDHLAVDLFADEGA